MCVLCVCLCIAPRGFFTFLTFSLYRRRSQGTSTILEGKSLLRATILIDQYHTHWFGNLSSAQIARDALHNFKDPTIISFIRSVSYCRETVSDEDLIALSKPLSGKREGGGGGGDVREPEDLDEKFAMWQVRRGRGSGGGAYGVCRCRSRTDPRCPFSSKLKSSTATKVARLSLFSLLHFLSSLSLLSHL